MTKLDEFIKERAQMLSLMPDYELGSAKQIWLAGLAEKAMRDAIAIAQSEDKE